MKKIVLLLAVSVLLFSCGGSQTEEATPAVDTTTVAVDTTKACCDTAAAASVTATADSTKEVK